MDSHTAPVKQQSRPREQCKFELDFSLEEVPMEEPDFPKIEGLNQNSKIFTTTVPHLGQVSKSKHLIVVFFVPDCPQRERLVQIILENGGCMSPYVEAQGFQILPEGAKNIESHPEQFFYNGLVVYEKWVHMCVKHVKFMPPSHEFRALVIKNGKKVPQLLKKKTAYTLLEVLEIWNEIQ